MSYIGKCCLFVITLLIFFTLLISSIEAKNKEIINYKLQEWNNIEYLDIGHAFNIAFANNPSIKIFISRSKQAKQKLIQARSSYFPEINFESTLVNNKNSCKNITKFYELGIHARWVIFDGFNRKFKNIIAKYGEEVSLLAIDEARRLLILSVSNAFYNAQLFRENIKIAISSENFNKRQLIEAETRYKKGCGSLEDILNFKIRLNHAKIARKDEEKNYKIAMLSLGSLLGISDPSFVSTVKLSPFLPETEEELLRPDWDSLVSLAVQQRPDINIRNLFIEQANANMSLKKTNNYPQIVLSTSISAEDDINFCIDNLTYSTYLGVSYQIFNGGLNTAQLKEAKENINELKHEMNDFIINAQLEIKTSILKVHDAQDKVIIQRKNNKLIEQTRNIVDKEYNLNYSSLVRLNEAQNDLIKSRSQLAMAVVNLRQALMELRVFMGEQIY